MAEKPAEKAAPLKSPHRLVLTEPIVLGEKGEKTISELVLYKPRVGDHEDAEREAGGVSATRLVLLVAKAARQSPAVIRQMDPDDFDDAVEIIGNFRRRSQATGDG